MNRIRAGQMRIHTFFTYYFLFFHVVSATATRYGLSRGLLGREYDRINISDSDSKKLIM